MTQMYTHRPTDPVSFLGAVYKTVRPMLSDCCSVCLTVCDVGVLSPNAWMIKMKVGIEVELGIGHTVLDGDPALPPRKRAQQPPIFSPRLLCPNGRPSQLLFLLSLTY